VSEGRSLDVRYYSKFCQVDRKAIATKLRLTLLSDDYAIVIAMLNTAIYLVHYS
jgi:hypothetical protein